MKNFTGVEAVERQYSNSNASEAVILMQKIAQISKKAGKLQWRLCMLWDKIPYELNDWCDRVAELEDGVRKLKHQLEDWYGEVLNG